MPASTCKRLPQRNDGAFGWLAVAAVVASWDVWALRKGHQTLSSAYAEALERGGWEGKAVIVSTAYLVCHLTRRPRLLATHDPLRVIAGGLRG